MTVKINGDNSFASPAITGGDDDSGIRINGNDVQIVRDSAERAAFDANGVRVIREAESFNGFQRTGAASTNDYIGTVNWQAQNSAGANTEYAKVNTQITDVTAGSENAKWYVQTQRDGTMETSLECHDGIIRLPNYPYCIASQAGQGWTDLNQTSGNPRNVGLLSATGGFHVNSNTDVFYAGAQLGAGNYRVIHVKYAGHYRVDLQLYQSTNTGNRFYIMRNGSTHTVQLVEASPQTEDMTSTYTAVTGAAAGDYFNFRVEYNNVNAALYWAGAHTQVTITKVG